MAKIAIKVTEGETFLHRTTISLQVKLEIKFMFIPWQIRCP
jgi:hypothetical protein